MTSFKSPEVSVARPQQFVFEFLNDFNNFEKLLPEQVINWEATEKHCSFTIKGMADLAMHMGENKPNHYIVYESEGKSPIDFNIEFMISESAENSTSKVKATLTANLNPMLKMVASRPLQNFVNMLSEKLQEVFGK